MATKYTKNSEDVIRLGEAVDEEAWDEEDSEEEPENTPDGVLIEVDKETFLLLSFLEQEADTWVAETDLCVYTGLSQSALRQLVEFINTVARSVAIDIEETNGDRSYRAEFFELYGAHVPYGTVFEDRVTVEVPKIEWREKIVEKPVEVPVPEPVVVGSAWSPKITKGSKKVSKRQQKVDTDILVWSDDLEVPASMGNQFVTPQWFPMVETMVGAGRHVALEGPPGTGKSTAVEELAAKYDKILVSINAENGLSKRDLTGFAEIRGEESWFFVAEYATAVKHGYWVKIDEVNAADADALLFINSQLAPPYIVNVHGKALPVHPDFRLFVTYNLGLVGTKHLPQSTMDRFFVIECGYPRPVDFLKQLYAHGVPDAATGHIFLRVAYMFWSNTEKMKFQLSPRRLFDASLLLNSGLDIETAMVKSILPYVTFAANKDIVLNYIKAALSDDCTSEVLMNADRLTTYMNQKALRI